jgi:hypothetical protein
MVIWRVCSESVTPVSWRWSFTHIALVAVKSFRMMVSYNCVQRYPCSHRSITTRGCTTTQFTWSVSYFCFMQVRSLLNRRCGTKLCALGSSNRKSVTPAFDRLVSGGCSFGDPAVLVAFRFDEGVALELPGPLLFWADTAFAFLLLVLRRMGRLENVDCTIGCSIMIVFFLAYK